MKTRRKNIAKQEVDVQIKQTNKKLENQSKTSVFSYSNQNSWNGYTRIHSCARRTLFRADKEVDMRAECNHPILGILNKRNSYQDTFLKYKNTF